MFGIQSTAVGHSGKIRRSLRTFRRSDLLKSIVWPISLAIASLGFVFSPALSVLTPTAKIVVESTNSQAFEPLSNAQCQELDRVMVETLKIEFVTPISAAFTWYENGTKEEGKGCEFLATGTGEELDDEDFANLQDTLIELGWVRDDRGFSASGPEGKFIGFRKGDDLAVIGMVKELMPGVECPENEPIASCFGQVTPNKILVTITLNAARRQSK